VRAPDAATEKRLEEIRREAELKGLLQPKQVPGYFDLPLLKQPAWTWEVPLYFFIGGGAGAAAAIGAAAQLTGGNERLVRDARWIAAIGANLSAPLLISDLGRPQRFLNMLRVFKPQSPMSVGAWIVAAFGAASTSAVILPRSLTHAAAIGSAISGLGMATYTGVLIGATSIPVWAKHAAILPAHFGASAAGSAVSMLEIRGHWQPALNAIGIGAAAFETITGLRIETSRDAESKPLREGTNGTITRIGGVLSGPVPLLLRIAGGKSKRIRRLAAASTIVGSLITRFAWLGAGRISARDVRPGSGGDATRAREAIGERAPARQDRREKSETSRQKGDGAADPAKGRRVQ
jgi:formate-dependent nitrite reductase membrane component NrfD